MPSFEHLLSNTTNLFDITSLLSTNTPTRDTLVNFTYELYLRTMSLNYSRKELGISYSILSSSSNSSSSSSNSFSFSSSSSSSSSSTSTSTYSTAFTPESLFLFCMFLLESSSSNSSYLLKEASLLLHNNNNDNNTDFISFSSNSSSNSSSSPVIHHYIFGYGSLINTTSRKRTGETGSAIAVRVTGLRRGWNTTCAHSSMTAVGVSLATGSTCNGVIVPILNPEVDLAKFDSREKYYTRVSVPLDAVAPYTQNSYQNSYQNSHQNNHQNIRSVIPSNSIIWTYVVNKPQVPTSSFPIAQTYLDVIVSGCLSISRAFAEEFVYSTEGWEYLWLNERSLPRYVRQTFEAKPDVDRLDSFLYETLSRVFSGRSVVVVSDNS